MEESLRKVQSFVIRHAAALNFSEIDVSDRLGGSYRNYVCEIVTPRGEAQGFGAAEGKTCAFLSALGEALERYFFRRQGRYKSSNGFAAHTDAGMARENARRELIERDAFLAAYHLRLPIRDITKDLLSKSTGLTLLLQQASRAGLQLRCGLLRDQDLFCVLAAVYPVATGGVLGLGSKTSMAEAAEKAVLEALLNAAVSPDLSELRLEAFLELSEADSHAPLAHLRLGLGPSLIGSFLGQITEKAEVINAPIKSEAFVFEMIETEDEFPGCPFTVVKASHPNLQDLYFGKRVRENLNLPRLGDYGPWEPHYLPHILG